MKIRLPARRELDAAVRYYILRRDHLGDEFRDEAWQTIQGIKDFPFAWHPLGGAIGRCQMRRFPSGALCTRGMTEDCERRFVAFRRHSHITWKRP